MTIPQLVTKRKQLEADIRALQKALDETVKEHQRRCTHSGSVKTYTSYDGTDNECSKCGTRL